jgi:UDP-4-amino-4,6-dideoxy-N-acetyl-beta-L-altrosamine transaminase
MDLKPLPYGRQTIEADDIAAVRQMLDETLVADDRLDAVDVDRVLAVFDTGHITQGPQVERFEAAFAEVVGAKAAVACASGTAALHLILAALDVGPGDVCVVPAITFLSTATAARLCGADVVFADVDPDTGLMTPQALRVACARAGKPIKVALAVHLAGDLCDMPALAAVAAELGVLLVEDACHALGSRHAVWGKAGECRHSVASAFSFHPVKTIACGEGGMVTTNDPALAARVARLRNHGVTREPALLSDAELSLDAAGQPNPWSYEQLELGFNYRMTDLEAALGLSQLGKLDRFVAARRELAALYDSLLRPHSPRIWPAPHDRGAALHLYRVHLDLTSSGLTRAELMRRLSARGIGTQVHYIPLYRQPYFAKLYGKSRLSGAEAYYGGILSLPLFPTMTQDDVRRVAGELIGLVCGPGA